MNNKPLPNITVVFELNKYTIRLTDQDTNQVQEFGNYKDVTNYEYEVQKNEEKRKILILKPEYLGAFVQDMKNMMKYAKSSQTINDTTKRVYNPKLKGV
jgi:Sec7-like guanine-nucleotide exchange factor